MRRTDAVNAAWPDVAALAQARDTLLAAERPDVLFAGVKVCPFAGYVEVGRVGCLLHPTRHPRGEDLRDLAVYPREVCANHFCAPHDWLRAREVDFAQTAKGTLYGRIVTDAGLVKALVHWLDDAGGRAFLPHELSRAAVALEQLWAAIDAWPWRDPDPKRFGGFAFGTDDTVKRTIPSNTVGVTIAVTASQRTVLDALGTRPLNDAEAHAALRALQTHIDAVVHAIAHDEQADRQLRKVTSSTCERSGRGPTSR